MTTPLRCINADADPRSAHARRVVYRLGLCKKCFDEAPPTGVCAVHPGRQEFRDGLCHTCWHADARIAARTRRASRVERVYGLTREQHEELFRLQGGRCPHGRKITLRSPVDHDHRTGAVRGLLCDPCNRFLGYVGDSPTAFLNLWAYAARPPAIVPRVTEHPFRTWPGLLQCTQVLPSHTLSDVRCGRLENEHA